MNELAALCRDLFSRWRQAVDFWDDDEPEEPSTGFSLVGQGDDGAWYQVECLDPDRAFDQRRDRPVELDRFAVYLHQPDGTRYYPHFWVIRADRAFNSVTGEAAPDGLTRALSGFVPFPREDELFAYRPDGGEVTALVMWRDNDRHHRPFIRPGQLLAGPIPPRVGACLTLPDQPGWPADLWDQFPSTIWPLVDDGRLTSLADTAAGSPRPPLWLTPADGRDVAAVAWVAPTGPGLPTAGVYNSRVDGDATDLTFDGCDQFPLGDFYQELARDREKVAAAWPLPQDAPTPATRRRAGSR